MLIRDYLPTARKRLVTIASDASIQDAARELARPGTDLLVVSDPQGKLVGVVTDTDIVKWVADHAYVVPDASVTTLMSKKVTSCGPAQSLAEVAQNALRSGLKHLPIVDEEGRAVGVIYVREALRTLLDEAEADGEWLRSYFSGTVTRAPSSR